MKSGPSSSMNRALKFRQLAELEHLDCRASTKLLAGGRASSANLVMSGHTPHKKTLMLASISLFSSLLKHMYIHIAKHVSLTCNSSRNAYGVFVYTAYERTNNVNKVAGS